MIEVRELTKRYGRTPAVDGLSFDVAPGVVTGFLGPNGAGKSTTMRMVLGLDTPASGSTTVVMAVPAFYSVIGVAGAFVFRSAAGGIVTALAVLAVPGLVGMLPAAVRAVLPPPLPVSALHSLSGLTEPGAVDPLGVLASIAVAALWTAAALGAAHYRLVRHDA